MCNQFNWFITSYLHPNTMFSQCFLPGFLYDAELCNKTINSSGIIWDHLIFLVYMEPIFWNEEISKLSRKSVPRSWDQWPSATLQFWTPDVSRIGSYKITHVSPSVSYHFFSKTGHEIILIFCMKLHIDNRKNVTEPFFGQKFWIIQKLQICAKKWGFWHFAENLTME